MNLHARRLRLALLTLAPVALFLAVFGGLTYRHVRQERLDRALIAAVQLDDAPTALKMLDQGADPNAYDRPNESPTGWRDWLRQAFAPNHLKQGLTALQLALIDPRDPYPYPSHDYTIALALLD